MSRQAWGKGRALLEALGLTRAQIAQCYGMHPLNEEESVQEGLQAWIEGGRKTTWGDLLWAMVGLLYSSVMHSRKSSAATQVSPHELKWSLTCMYVYVCLCEWM